jgi:hypothetical protein
MRRFSPGHVGQTIERVRELSADAHIKLRRNISKDCLAFHSLTGRSQAYGKRFSLRFNSGKNSNNR